MLTLYIGSYVMHNSESVFETLPIITKKRYIGKLAVDKMIHKGIVVLRGFICAFLKTFYSLVIEMILIYMPATHEVLELV